MLLVVAAHSLCADAVHEQRSTISKRFAQMQCSPTKHVFSGAAPSEPAQPLWLPQRGRAFLVPSECETALQRTINGQSANETHAAALDGTAQSAVCNIAGSGQLVLDALSSALCAAAACLHLHGLCLESVFIRADCFAAVGAADCGASAARVCGLGADDVATHYRAVAWPSGDASPNASASDDAADDAESGYSTAGP